MVDSAMHVLLDGHWKPDSCRRFSSLISSPADRPIELQRRISAVDSFTDTQRLILRVQRHFTARWREERIGTQY
jgi:hypothetical protein